MRTITGTTFTSSCLALRGMAVFLSSLLLLCCSPALQAVQLGDEAVLSYLGDPVEVEIDVLQWEDLDFDNVEIRVASKGEYEAFNLAWLPILEDLNFNLVGPNSRGEVRILVSTREPAVEPYIELLLIMRWPGGALLREYVLLFDLPEAERVSYQAPSAETRQEAQGEAEPAAEVTANAALEPEPEPEAAPAANPPEPLIATGLPAADQAPNARTEPAISVETLNDSPPVREESNSAGRRVYQVREGELLWNIAQQFVPAGSGENIYQMLISLHELNRGAFLNGNISLLKAGSLLQIPDAADIAGIDPATAQAVFEQRWFEGTRGVQLASTGAGPDFSELNPEEADTAVAGEETAQQPERSPGEETGAARPTAGGPLLPTNTPVVVPAGEQAAQEPALVVTAPTQDEPAADTTADQPAAGSIAEPSVAQAVPSRLDIIADNGSYNPYLEDISASAREVRELIATRSAYRGRMEQELQAMRTRVQETRGRVSELNARLAEAVEQRQSGYRVRNPLLLGVFVTGLLAALVMAVILILTLISQQRRAW